jgi:hypothetical protein
LGDPPVTKELQEQKARTLVLAADLKEIIVRRLAKGCRTARLYFTAAASRLSHS